MKNMKKARSIAAIFMCLVLAALIALAFVAVSSPPLKIFAITASVYGFYEVYKWLKK